MRLLQVFYVGLRFQGLGVSGNVSLVVLGYCLCSCNVYQSLQFFG